MIRLRFKMIAIDSYLQYKLAYVTLIEVSIVTQTVYDTLYILDKIWVQYSA